MLASRGLRRKRKKRGRSMLSMFSSRLTSYFYFTTYSALFGLNSMINEKRLLVAELATKDSGPY
jgi:hypothetical protein